MGPILAIYPTFTWLLHMKPMLFCHLDLSQHKKWMAPAPIGMDYLYAAILKMAASVVKFCFRTLLSIWNR